MGFLDMIAGSKMESILAGVVRLTSWATGMDTRISEIERRLGVIEMALTLSGRTIPNLPSLKDKGEK